MSANTKQKDAEFLKRGDIGKILIGAGVSRMAYSKWMRGEFESPVIEMYFNKIVDKRKEEFEKFSV